MSQRALTDLYEAKAGAYSRFNTGLIAEHAERLLPAGGRVLDLGCASGGLLEILRPRAGHLAGLELSASGARAATQVGDHVVQASIDDPDLPFEADSYDLVVLADVLDQVLERAVGWCRPGGRWPSEETGTFDAGHLRFFTRESFAALLHDAGLERVELEAVVPRLHNHLPIERVRHRRPVRRLDDAWQRLGRRLPTLLGYQLVAVARRPEARRHPLPGARSH